MLQTLDTTSLIPVCKFAAHATYITRVLLSPDIKHLATCSADHTTRIWSVDSSSESNGPDTPTMRAVDLPAVKETEPGELHMGSSKRKDDAAIAEREPGAFPLEATLQGHQRWVWDCAFSADSAYLVTACSDHYARLWELQTQSIIRQYNGHHRGAVCVALNDYSEAR